MSANIATEINAGKSPSQAEAIAYHTAGKDCAVMGDTSPFDTLPMQITADKMRRYP